VLRGEAPMLFVCPIFGRLFSIGGATAFGDALRYGDVLGFFPAPSLPTDIVLYIMLYSYSGSLIRFPFFFSLSKF
jgi:hypothetical protein